MLDQDPTHLEDSSGRGMDRAVVGLNDDLRLGILHLRTGKRDDSIGLHRVFRKPTRVFNHSDNVVVMDPRRPARSQKDRENR